MFFPSSTANGSRVWRAELFHWVCLNIDSPYTIVSGKCGAVAKSPLAAEKERVIDLGGFSVVMFI